LTVEELTIDWRFTFKHAKICCVYIYTSIKTKYLTVVLTMGE